MNKYIEEYISQRKKELVEDEQLAKQAEKEEILEKLHLGKREYFNEFPDEPENNFPCYDSEKNEYFRYNMGEVSDNDYIELLKYLPKEDKPKKKNDKKMSGWYTFAIVMMILCCIGGVIGALSSEEYPVAIMSVLGSIIFFSQIILLCKIEYNTRAED
jgi:lipopolysaccharide export LptBFGC system permease protein LptF